MACKYDELLANKRQELNSLQLGAEVGVRVAVSLQRFAAALGKHLSERIAEKEKDQYSESVGPSEFGQWVIKEAESYAADMAEKLRLESARLEGRFSAVKATIAELERCKEQPEEQE